MLLVKTGSTNLGLMHIRNREDALDPVYLERMKQADAVLFSGGNQMRLSTIFGGTELLRCIHEKYRNDHFLVAGTSAGAMAMSRTMIYEGNATRAHFKGEVKITTGLGFMDNVIFDSHFEKRGRFQPACPGCFIKSFLHRHRIGRGYRHAGQPRK